MRCTRRKADPFRVGAPAEQTFREVVHPTGGKRAACDGPHCVAVPTGLEFEELTELVDTLCEKVLLRTGSVGVPST